MIMLLEQTPRLKKSDLFSQTLNLFGHVAVRKNYVPRLDQLLEKMLAKGELQNIGNFISKR